LIAEWDCNYAVAVITICAQDSPMHLNFEHMPAIDVGLPRISELCLKFWHKYSIWSRQSPCQIGFSNKWCWICHTTTQNICRQFSGAPEHESNGSKSCGFAQDQPSWCLIFCHSYWISPWHTLLPNWICKSAMHDLSKRDSWHITYGQDSPVHLKVVELGIVNSIDFDMCTWLQVSSTSHNHCWRMILSPSQQHSQNST